jgi:DNA polymerase
MYNLNKQAVKAALQWSIESGVDEFLSNTPFKENLPTNLKKNIKEQVSEKSILGAPEAKEKAIELCKNIKTTKELKQVLESFDGLDIKKTSSNLVFSDGNPNAKIMFIGDAPGSDEDKSGIPFYGESGKLLDRILSFIALGRNNDNPSSSVYLTNILNWRPPGNRSPTSKELEIALPFIEKHISLINPSILVLFGNVSAKLLLTKSQNLSKLRGNWYEYQSKTISNSKKSIPTITTYRPSDLINNPSHKKAVWEDMLMIQRKRADLKLLP